MDVTKLIKFIETLPVGDGDLLGEKYRLLLGYQKRFLRGAFKPGSFELDLPWGGAAEKPGLLPPWHLPVYSPILPYIETVLRLPL